MPQDKNSKKFSFPLQLGIFLGLTGAGMIVYSLLSGIIWVSMTGSPLSAMTESLGNPAYATVFIVLQVVATLFMMFLPAILFARICYKDANWFLGTKTATSKLQFILVVGILMMVFPLGGALAEINELIPIPEKWAVAFRKMEDSRKAMEDALININTFGKYLMSMVVIALLPAIFEEFFFRGGLQNLLTRWFDNAASAVIVTAIIFSLIHQSYYGFLVRVALGVVLGYVFYLSGSIWLSVFLHFLFNGLQVTALYISKISGDNISDTLSGQTVSLIAGVPALIIIIILFRKFDKESLRIHEKFVYKEPDPGDISDWIAKK